MTRAADLVSGFGRLATLRFVILLACLFPTTFAFGHEVRPAYLELKEESPGLFNVLFKTPMRGDARLALDVSFSGRVQKATPVISRMTDDAMVQTWRLSAVESLAGQELRIDGLSNTMTDALVRIEFADGREWIERLTPGTPGAIIPAGQSGWMVVVTYLKLGVEHIILGVDHLLFVLALILIAPNLRELIKAITAFTAAHSITLAAATLGFVHVPPKPVEATIALSIVLVAAEALHGQRTLSRSWPALVAFLFGLVHGLGFAGALREIGLPQQHLSIALLTFNAGVEIGQLFVVTLAFGLYRALARWPTFVMARTPALYAIGTIAAYWSFGRVITILGG